MILIDEMNSKSYGGKATNKELNLHVDNSNAVKNTAAMRLISTGLAEFAVPNPVLMD